MPQTALSPQSPGLAPERRPITERRWQGGRDGAGVGIKHSLGAPAASSGPGVSTSTEASHLIIQLRLLRGTGRGGGGGGGGGGGKRHAHGPDRNTKP